MKINIKAPVVTPIKSFDPFNMDWEAFKVGKSVQGTTLWADDIVGIAPVKGKNVLWVPFASGTAKFRGDFFEFADIKAFKKAELEPIELTRNDFRAAHLAIYWDRARAEKREVLAKDFLSLTISERFRKTKPTLYRGLAVTKDDIQKLRAGKELKLKKRDISSWSEKKFVTDAFVKSEGIMLTYKPNKADVVVNIHALDMLFHLPFQERLSFEHEVLLKGNGCGDSISDKTVKWEVIEGRRAKEKKIYGD